ncbi:universal stress protein [Bacillus marinisedimentorum]|uniref:universal stress protein n=1 Tax=Bacillus marinisedimentorum TaxID=1821260 RepID=UPI0008724414|nr:universal stress protein [Bacillus marinisedimentorum]
MLNVYSRILVAYDGSELAGKALDFALKAAQEDEQVEVDVVTVFNPPVSMGSYGMYNETTINEMKEDIKNSMGSVEEKLAELPNKTSTHILEGVPGKRLVDFAKEHDSDLIIIGNRGFSGLKEMFLGSVSHYVVQRAHCPVFVIK